MGLRRSPRLSNRRCPFTAYVEPKGDGVAFEGGVEFSSRFYFRNQLNFFHGTHLPVSLLTGVRQIEATSYHLPGMSVHFPVRLSTYTVKKLPGRRGRPAKNNLNSSLFSDMF